MLSRIFPRQIDNSFRGYRLAIWILGLILAGRIAMGLNGTFNTHFVAMNADGIPLDSYAAGAAETVIALFALLALTNLVIGLLGIAVLIRWRAMIPFFYLLMLLQSVANRIILYLHPIARSGAENAQIGTLFVLGLMTLTAIGFILSLLKRLGSPPRGDNAMIAS